MFAEYTGAFLVFTSLHLEKRNKMNAKNSLCIQCVTNVDIAVVLAYSIETS